MDGDHKKLCIALVLCLLARVCSVTNPNDFRVLNDFRNGLVNPELLGWPTKGMDPCGPPSWPHVFCSHGRVTQIQVQGLGLEGTLPQSLNQLEYLTNVGFQKNKFTGKLPSLSGLSNLQFAYLDFNEFDTIPEDFFDGLSSLRAIALDRNPLNATDGWSIPRGLKDSVQLANFSCSGCNLIGPLPDFFGKLTSLKLSDNRLTGELPASFKDSMLQILLLNDQEGDGMSGSIDVIGSMVGLTQVWLHGNSFNGTIPSSIGGLTSLRELSLSRNKLVGLIPPSLANLNLKLLNLNNNMLMGPIPKFSSGSNVSYSSNSFCQPNPGDSCSPQVNALIDFLGGMNFPPNLASQWAGNDPCKGPWWGITCNSNSQVSIINLKNLGLDGTLSPALASLSSLIEIHLNGNRLTGSIPANLTLLSFLRLLDLDGNNFMPPVPRFLDSVKVIIDGNPHLTGNGTVTPISPSSSPPSSSPEYSDGSEGGSQSIPPTNEEQFHRNHAGKKHIVILAAILASTALIFGAILFTICCFTKKKHSGKGSRDGTAPNNLIKLSANNVSGAGTGYSFESTSSGMVSTNVISFQILCEITNNFSAENELGRGGFGAVYKGEFGDGTIVAVKRMEAAVISKKAMDEFQAEIAVLSKVRHRHVVSLLGYAIEGNEKLLIYEYMPQGALSLHLFRWKDLNLEPLSWTRRVNIALDVARGLEYLHNLAHQSFIHRDLKSSNILLGNSFRAKIADFGLVKLAPDQEKSVATRLAGTFGYLAPEYAVTGKITTKADVFSFGVVLMELLTGLMAIDDHRSEESRYLVEWFLQMKSKKGKLACALDPALDFNEEILESVYVVAELAGHCTARDPNHRPNMGHVVSVLAMLVDKWKPFDEEVVEENCGIDYNIPLTQMLRDWQESADSSLQDSRRSTPVRPTGFADSFMSDDAR